MSDDDKPDVPAAEKARRRWKGAARPPVAKAPPAAPPPKVPGWSAMLTDVVATAMAQAGFVGQATADDGGHDDEGSEDDGDLPT